MASAVPTHAICCRFLSLGWVSAWVDGSLTLSHTLYKKKNFDLYDHEPHHYPQTRTPQKQKQKAFYLGEDHEGVDDVLARDAAPALEAQGQQPHLRADDAALAAEPALCVGAWVRGWVLFCLGGVGR